MLDKGGSDPNSHDIYLSKIKKVAIELKDFHFFHSSYQLKYKDERFIGRRKKIEQLKNVLTDTITDSGTYLISGYRGSGKTSFVNMVLLQIAPIWRFSDRLRILLRCILVLMFTIPLFQLYIPLPWYIFSFLALLSWQLLINFDPFQPTYRKRSDMGLAALKEESKLSPKWLKTFCFYLTKFVPFSFILLFCRCLCLLFKMLTKKESNLSKVLNKCWEKCGNNVFRVGLYIDRNVNWNNIIITAFRVVFIVSFFLMLVSGFCGKCTGYSDIIPGQVYAVLAIFFYWLTLKTYDLCREQKKKDSKTSKGFGSLLNYFFEQFKPILKPRIVIRLNLNYDNLNERNILQLIASTLYERYRKWRRTRLQLFLRFSKIALFWVLVCCPYQYYNMNGKIAAFSKQEYYSSFLINYPEANQILRTIQQNEDKYVFIDAKKISFDLKNKLGPQCVDEILSRTSYLYQLKTNLSAQIRNIFSNDKSQTNTRQFQKYPVISTTMLPELVYQNANVIYKQIRAILSAYYHNPLFRRIPVLADISKRLGDYIYPPDFEPLMFMLFFLEIFIVYFLFHSRIVNLPGHNRVLRMLRELNERMAAAVTIKTGTSLSGLKGAATWIRGKNLTYPLADERTIEQEIIRILEEISSLPVIFGHPVILFVFDELDKITLQEKMTKTQTEETLYMTSYDNMRRRQQQVEKILANLKQLLTTSNAKFIFIAGREMLDAGLADFTSRSFLHNSIFNQTLYIDSFLTDHSDPNDKSLSALAESYVCRFLLPPVKSFRNKSWPKLDDYKDYIQNQFDMKEQELTKIIQVLHDFVTYLTYRGNGSPKKMTQLFESFIQSFPDDINKDEWLVVGESHKSRYLVFNYSQQYIIGSTSRLLEPLHRTVERSSTSLFNDKLATSIFMVLDHLFKFHRSAFRRDFLEWMPEMLDIHRDPDLRNVIQEMLRLIEKTYLKRVDNGLFDYRFSNRIKGEIDFSSRIAELESAVFNFTLDESLQAEEFVRRQLKDQLQFDAASKINKENKPGSSCTLSGLHEIIGDLHAFDEEYNMAITEYLNALDRIDSDSGNGGEQ